MNRLSVQGVRDIVLDRMVNNLYPVGTKLPTARELAAELGVHRNTVSKAYALLGDLGLVVSKPGRGTFAVAIAEQTRQSGLAQHLDTSIENVMLAARRLGISENDLRTMLESKISEAYMQSPRGSVFIECNPGDLHVGIKEIEASIDIQLDGLLIDDLKRDPSRMVEKYGVVCTNLIHVKEINDLLGETNGDLKIVGIYTQPDENALTEIASIRPNSKVGVLVDSTEGARRFENQIHTFNPVDLRVVLSHDDADVRKLAEEVDVIVSSRSREEQIARLNLDVRSITLPFHISRQSADRLLDALLTANGSKSHALLQPTNEGGSSIELPASESAESVAVAE